MRTTRFAASLSLAVLATAPILMAATPLRSHHPPITASASSTSTASAEANALLKETAPFALGRGGLATITKAKLFTFTATLNGSYNVPAGGMYYVFASMSGGTSPYTYRWYLNDWYMGSQYNSASSVSGNFCCVGTNYFRVDVTDANGQTAQSNQFFVHVY
jgi:hypothetical protein